jgi:hypothetical protein
MVNTEHPTSNGRAKPHEAKEEGRMMNEEVAGGAA